MGKSKLGLAALIPLTLIPLTLVAGCKTASSATDTVKSAAQGAASTATSLVNVNLSNVLNDLAFDLKIDKANIPVNAQIPITIAANVCGVSINILSVGAGGGSSQGCTAQNSSPELSQAVLHQLAAGGSVGGGAQTSGATSTTPTTTTPTAQPQAQPAPQQTPPQTPQELRTRRVR
jgi:hypothetical protein